MRYYPIDETLFREACPSAYEEGLITTLYRTAVDEIAEIAEQQKRHVNPACHAQIDLFVNRYAERAADNVQRILRSLSVKQEESSCSLWNLQDLIDRIRQVGVTK